MITPEKEVLEAAATSFRVRAKKLRRNATITLALIIAVLVAGIGIFLFAGEIANREANRALIETRRDKLRLIESRLLEARDEAAKAEFEVRYQRDRLMREESGLGDTKSRGHGPQWSYLRSKVVYAEEHLRDKLANLSNLERQQELARAELVQVETTQQLISRETQLSTMVSTIVTRTGSIILLLFLVQILVPLYRYNTRLAAYYDARGDALSVVDLDGAGNIEGLERLISALSPDSVSFGNPPSSPMEQAVRLATHVLPSRGGT